MSHRPRYLNTRSRNPTDLLIAMMVVPILALLVLILVILMAIKRPITPAMAMVLLRDMYCRPMGKTWQGCEVKVEGEPSDRHLVVYYTGMLDNPPKKEFRGFRVEWKLYESQ